MKNIRFALCRVAIITILGFALLAGASFFGSKRVHSEPAFDLSKAKTVKDLPPGMLPVVTDELFALGTMPSGAVMEIDATSVRLIDGKASFLMTIVEPEGTITEEGDHILGIVFKQVTDCKLHKYSILYSLLISEEGRIVTSITNPRQAVDIKPETPGAKLEALVCKAPGGVPFKAPAKMYPKGSESV